MTLPTPLSREELDHLTALTQRGELGLELLDVPAPLLGRALEHLRRIESLERMAIKMIRKLPPGVVLLLVPSEAAEYDRLSIAAALSLASDEAAAAGLAGDVDETAWAAANPVIAHGVVEAPAASAAQGVTA